MESREETKQWVKPGESVSKLSKTKQSAGKVMVSVFWDAHGVIFIDYLEKGRTIIGAYYAALVYRLIDERRNDHIRRRKNPFS